MKRSTWRVLAFGALLGAIALPASAQVVIGGSGSPSVEVNWSVLDGLGRQPTLADMLKADVPGAETRPAAGPSTTKGVQYKPFKPGAKPYAKPAPAKLGHAAVPKPKKAAVVQASAKSERLADLVQSSHAEAKSAAPAVPAKAPIAEIAKVEPKPDIAGPQIALPELPKPVAATAPVPLTTVEAPKVEVAKAEPAKVDAPKVELPKAEPAPLPPTVLTPPPLKAEPAVVKVEAPVPVPPPTQIASLPPAPEPVAAPAPAAAPRGGDVLTVAFSSESATLPAVSHGELDRLVKRVQKDEALGLQLMAYAEGDEANASKARRLSLSRALEVRKYLMEQGIRSTRIEVRALGNKLEGGGSPDRVDAVVVSR